MKKIFLCIVMFVFATAGFAQQDTQQPNDDQLQQQVPRETQRATERAAAKEARKKAAESKQKKREAKARKDAFIEKHPALSDTLKDKKKEETPQAPQ